MLTNPTTTTSAQQIYPPQSRPSSLTILPQPSVHFFSTGNTPTYTTALNHLHTPTTPITLTPNTMKTIEQSILQTLGEDTEENYMMESQQYSGNFVPPLPSSTSTITLINTWQGGQVCSDGGVGGEEEMKPMEEDIKPTVIQEDKMTDTKKKKQPAKKAPQPKPQQQPKQTKKAQPKSGGRKGAQNRDNEEDERRKIRRERNKMAAARCRKRRVDHTNKLIEETEGLKAKKQALQNQITELQSLKEELEFLLENHGCQKHKGNNGKCDVLADLQNLPRTTADFIGGKLKRPSTLSVVTVTTASGNERSLINVSTPAPPVSITTPSNGIAGLGFEPLCDWGVATPDGLSSDKGGHSAALPDKNNSGSLVTPIVPYKKLQEL